MEQTNYHTHTKRCHHAYGEDEEYVLAAISAGYSTLGFSDHTPWNYASDFVSNSRMLPHELSEYVQSIGRLKEKYKAQIDIHIGLEVEYFPQYLPWLREQMAEQGIEYAILGNHYYHSDETAPYFGVHTDSQYMLELYCEGAIEGMESGLYGYVAHPDLFMSSYPDFDDCCERISRTICQTAKRLNLPLEYNLGLVPYADQLDRVSFPHPQFWQIACEEGCTAIIGVDAHTPQALGKQSYYTDARNALESLGIAITETLGLAK